MRRRMRPFIMFLVALLIVTILPSGFAQAEGPLTESAAVSLLQSFGIVKGDPSGDLALGDKLTRAQAAIVFVRVMGALDQAEGMAASNPFTDAKGHWAAGEIAMANALGLMRGDGDGTFRPQSEITYAELYTVLLRMTGREYRGTWNPQLIATAASQVGFAVEGVNATSPAIRGKFFLAVANAITQVTLPSGKTLLQTYVDSTPPQLTLDQTQITTSEANVMITGSAQDAVQVRVANQTASLNTVTGRFSYTHQATYGSVPIRVEAMDRAGNVSAATVTVERRSPVTRIQISGPASIKAGTSVPLEITATDSQNRSLPLNDISVELTGDVASFDLATKILTAGNRNGNGRLTLKAGNVSSSYSFSVSSLSSRANGLSIRVNDGRAPSVGKDAQVTVSVIDANGNLVTDDNFRSIRLSASDAYISISPSVATTVNGVARFTIRGTREAQALLTAKSESLPDALANVTFLTTTRVVLSASPTTLRPDGTSSATITASLQDDTGRPVTNNSNSDIQITLNSDSTSSVLTDVSLTIRRGFSSSSGYNGSIRAGLKPETVIITGRMDSGHPYGIQPLSLPVNGALSGARLQVLYPSGRTAPGQPAQLIVRVLDANNQVVTAGSYAFQLNVTTSNREPVSAGVPEGVQLLFPNTTYRPIDDGRAPSDPLNDANAIVARTYQGQATLQLTYDKSGIVTVTPKLIGYTEQAYHPAIGFGAASPTTGMTSTPFDVTFSGLPAKLVLTADSALGKGQPGAASGSNSSTTIRVQVVDQNGAPIPGYSEAVTLNRSSSGNGVTSILGGVARKNAANGVADFVVQPTGATGFDMYTATSGSMTSQPLTVSIRNGRPDAPSIVAIRGVKDGDHSPITGYVGPDADYMDIQLAYQASAVPGEQTNWVQARVYRKGESSPFFTSGAVNLMSDLPVIRIPKSSLRAGSQVYEVTIFNGVSESVRSADEGRSTAVTANYNTNYRVASAFFDAETGKLTLNTSGLATGGTIDPTKITLVKGDNQVNLGSDTVSVVSVNSSAAVLQLGELATRIDPEVFNGSVTVELIDGWFVSQDRTYVAKGNIEVPLKPMPLITHATLDVPASRLYLHGIGLSQGTLSLDLVKFNQGSQAVALRPGSQATQDRLVSTTDSVVTINLSSSTLNALTSLAGGNVFITADVGWLKTTAGTVNKAAAITQPTHLMYTRVLINSAQYNPSTNTLTVYGVGLSGATVDPSKFVFRSPGVTDWSPASTAAVLVDEANAFTIRLSDTDAASFESRFGNKNVFLNTNDRWLIDAQGFPGAPIPTNSVLFFVPR